MDKFSKNDLADTSNLNTDQWQSEAFGIMSDFVYTGIKKNEDLPSWYIEEG